MNNQEITLGGFLDEWLEKAIRASVRYSTYASYKGYIENHIKRFLGAAALSDVKPADVQEFVGELTDEGRLGARTIGLIVGVLKNAFNYAEDYELIIKNPCRRIRLPKVEEEEVVIFDDAEQTRIEQAISVCGADDTRYYGVLFTLYTGVRIGELCALKWENIDYINRCIHVKKSLNRAAANDADDKKTQMVECEPKTKRSKRVIQLPDFLGKILKKLQRESRSDYIFSMKSGKYVHPRTMQNLHKRLLKKAGVMYSNFHALRHTFATRAAEINTDPKTVSETLGHTGTAITLNRYTHSLREQKQRMMDGLNSYFKDKKIATLT